MKVGDLRPAGYNPRKLSKEQEKALKQALEVFGDLGGIVFNRRTQNLVSGHQRVKTMEKDWEIRITDRTPDKCGTIARGSIMTPFGELSYREVDWEEKVEKAANIAANKHGGSWDDSALKDLLVELDNGSGLIELTGFSEVDLQGLIDRGAAAELPPLPSESDKLFEQMTFTLTKEQAAVVRSALALSINAGNFEETGNENRNGNALERIAKNYKGGR